MNGRTLDARTTLLGRVAEELGSATSIKDALHSLVAALVPEYCDACEVAMPDQDGTLRRVASGPATLSEREGTVVPDVADHPVRLVFQRGRPLLLDVDRHPAAFGPPDVPQTARALGVCSAVLAPLTGRAGTIGVLAVANGGSGRRLDAEDAALVPIIARLVALAIENHEALDQQRLVANRLRRASRVAAALNAADDLPQIGSAIVDVAGSELGASTGLLFAVDDDDLELIASRGHDDAQLAGWRRFPLAVAAPASDACRSGQAVVCEDHAQILTRYPRTADVAGFQGRALLAVPVAMGHEVLGAACWSFARPRRFSDDELSFVNLLTEQVGAAMARVRARRSSDEQAGRLNASRARLAALAGVGVIGTAAGRDDRILEANQTFLDLLGLAPLPEEGVSFVTLTPPEWAGRDEVGVVELRRTGRMAPFEKEYLHRDGSRVRVLIGGATLSLEPFEWMVFVVDLRAKRAAELAAERANERLTELLIEQRRIADVLRASLLPASLPSIDGLELHAEHWPESSDGLFGGDFYDVFPTDERRWGLLIGDVCGKGVEAAAVTATARHTARAAATHLRGPDAVLRWVHEAVAEHPLDTFCTVAFAMLSAEPPGFLLDVSLGGHPPGLVCHADGGIEELGLPGSLLGLFPPNLTTSSHRLLPDDVMMFYTDGVTDAPEDEAMPDTELATWLCQHRDRSPSEIGKDLREELLRRRPAGLRDDVAIIVAKVT
ncbi:MAG: SpoIIE family protein phosphatase [Ilumatobacteraceae bacterium]